MQILGIVKLLCPADDCFFSFELCLPFNNPLQFPFCFSEVRCPLPFIDELSDGQASLWFVFVPNTNLKLKLCLPSLLSLLNTLGRLKDLGLRRLESSREEPFSKLPNTRGILSVDLPICRDVENALKHISLSFFSKGLDSILGSLVRTMAIYRDTTLLEQRNQRILFVVGEIKLELLCLLSRQLIPVLEHTISNPYFS